MRLLARVIRRSVVAGVFLALVVALGLGSAQPALAASYSLTASSCGTTTTGKSCKITATFKKNGKAVKSATVLLQYKKGSKWVTEKKVKIAKGKATITVKHGVTDRKYRLKVSGKKTSKSFTVHFIPSTFAISGSGSGHGVGMSQYGAYRMALDGKSAERILAYYYPGAAVSSANNNSRTIKVQVFGATSDPKTSTTVKVTGGELTISDGKNSVRAAAGKTVKISVAGTQVRATGAAATLTGSRLTFSWDTTKATASVAGARGAAKQDVGYRYGNLQATVISGRLNVVNELKMNTEYLYGVDEMASSWGGTAKGLEALKAQAIAARTYVISQASVANQKWGAGGANPACDCQVYDDTRSQNFVGWNKAGGSANEPWRKAVDATMTTTTVQIVRTSAAAGAGIAETPYFAASGSYQVGSKTYGGTANNADVFRAAGVPYLKHVADPYSAKAAPASLKSWSVKLSQAKAKQIFGSAVKKLAVAARYSSGQVKSIKATFANGKTKTVTKKAAEWQSTLGVQGAWLRTITGK